VCSVFGPPRAAGAQTLAYPSGWTHTDIGSPAVPGKATSNGDTITVTGAGTDVDGTSDEFHFAYQEVSGDVDFRVRVSSLQMVDPGAKAGLMIRGSLAPDAEHAFIFVSAGQGLAFQRRTRDTREVVRVDGPAAQAPVWLRLVRQGNVFSAYSSSTGGEWTLVSSTRINMDPGGYIGLAVTSNKAMETAAASFTSLSSGFSSSLPASWTAGDIGSPLLSGEVTASGGTFRLTGAGQEIWGTSDQFQFVHQPVTGSTDVVARVASLEAADGGSKAGIMIRDSLTDSAAHASVFATGSNAWMFQQRLSPGGVSYYTAGSEGAAPGWVRLVREGNLFSAYQSEDGSAWTLIGSDTIAMPATVYVGLAVTSQVVSETATATISNVSISTPASINKAPSVTLSAPSAGASFTAGANITISATAGDVDGSVTRVDFYAGVTLVGSDAAAPFSTTWSGAPAGTYSLTAVATDNDGIRTTSAPISVTVAAVPVAAVSTTLVFGAPTNYATHVTSCTVELRRAVDIVIVAPVATRNLGKPAVAGGNISVDISTLVDPLPSGSYYAVVLCTGPGGTTPSTPSAVFSK
jgi:regulation of enolase protein 1 (concanavalin A-like superfamily)